MEPLVRTSVGDFEVGWGTGVDGSIWLEVDPDGGLADNPEFEEMKSQADVAALFVHVGVTAAEAESLAAEWWSARPRLR